MVMDSLVFTLFFLLTISSSNHVFSFASQPSYTDHCGSIVRESTPNGNTFYSFPLGDRNTGYFTGGDSIIDIGTSLNQYFFYFNHINVYETESSGLFNVKGTVSLISTMTYYPVRNFSYHRSRYERQRGYIRSHVSFKLDGFWSESSGKVCMVGTGKGYSKGGNDLNLDVVFKLDNVYQNSNITSLVNGSLESLCSKKDESYFAVSVLMFPKANYSYTLDSIEVVNEFSSSSSSDATKGNLPLNSLSFCSGPLSRAIRRLQLEFSSECNSSKNCTPFSESSGPLPSQVSLKGFECSANNKHRVRILVRFSNISDFWISKSLNPKTMLVGEGWWDDKKSMLYAVACHIIGKTSSSFAGTHIGDCSTRLRLRFPSTWSINSTSSIVGQIWTNMSTNDPSYFKMIAFRNEEDRTARIQATKYEYSQLDRVKKLCPPHKPVKNKGKRYPDAYSYDMRFDMSVRESNKRVGWGYSSPLSVGDHISTLDQNVVSISNSSEEASETVLVPNDGTLFNISYKIILMYNSTLNDRNSVFNLSSSEVRILAEGIYDAGSGNLCMVGCRNLYLNSRTPTAHSVDCEIVVKFLLPPLDSKGIFINGSIESTRKKSDPLYFKPLFLSSSAFYTEEAKKTVWRMDMETIMVLLSTTLACVFVALQLYHVKRHPNVLPLLSLIMMTLLTLGHMIPLVLNFEALLSQNPNNKNFVLGNSGWLEVNEIAIRLITMVAFLLQFRLLQLTWSSRKSDESQKGIWNAEWKAAFVTLPLYAAGLLIALLLKLKKSGDEAPLIASLNQHHSSWENLKSYGGLVLDGFLLPQIILNLFSNMKDNVLSSSFYFGTTFVRLLPHAYDLYRIHNFVHQDGGSYFYADPSADFYSTAWDIVIPLGGILFAIIIYLQQRFGAHYILPNRFKGSGVYEKVPVVAESEAEVETTNL